MSTCCQNPRTSSPRTKPSRGKAEVLLLIPNAIVHLTGDPDASAVELARGDLAVSRITEDGVALATVVRVGEALRWPLTKDEPIVKLDQLHYLFSIPNKDGSFLNYGVSFAGADDRLASFDRFLTENACFSASPMVGSSSSAKARTCEVYWKDYAPKIENYNGALAKAIAQGTGQIVKGIFHLSNAYTAQVHASTNLIHHPQSVSNVTKTSVTKHGEINKALQRARKLSEMTEKMSRALLNGVVAVSGSIAAPVLRSQAAKSFFSAVPGEPAFWMPPRLPRGALWPSPPAPSPERCTNDSEKAQAKQRTTLAAAGNAMGTARNVLKIRTAFNPKFSLTSSLVRNAASRNA